MHHSGRVHKLFQGIKERKSPGPDGIGGRILKKTVPNSWQIFFVLFLICHFNFTKFLAFGKTPLLCLYNSPKSLSDCRPVALTSLSMKTFEKLVKDELLSSVQENLDSLQFAYRGRGVADATSTLLNMIFISP